MKNLFQNNKNIIITIILFIVAFGVFKYFQNSDTTTTPIDSSVLSAGKDVVDLSNSIQSATLDKTLFTIPAYRALQDFSTDIASQPIGRKNPFSPIGIESGQFIDTPVVPTKPTKK